MRHGTTGRTTCTIPTMPMAASVLSATAGHGMPFARICRGTLSPFWIPTAILWPGIPTTPEAESCQSPMVTATSTLLPPSSATLIPSGIAGIIMIPKQDGITSIPGIMIPKSNVLSMRMGLLARMEFSQDTTCLLTVTTIL